MIRPLLLLLLLSLSAPSARAACGAAEDALPAPYDAIVRGESALAAGRYAEAIAALESVDDLPDGPAPRRVAVLLGKAKVLSGDLTGAAGALRAALAGGRDKAGVRASPCDGDPAEARWWAAQASVRGGDYDAAVPRWRAIWTRNPTSPFSDDAEALLRKHDAAFVGPDPAAAQALIVERFETLAALNQHKAALKLLEEQVVDDGSPDHQRRRAQALFRAREYRRAVEEFEGLAQPYPQDRFDRALAASRYGDYVLAATLYAGIVEDLLERADGKAERRLVDTASFKIGYLDYDAGRLDAGLSRFAEHLERLPSSRHADEAHWFMGWSLFKQGRYDEADAAFGRLIAEHGGSSLAAGGRYWKARIAGIRGDAAAETAGLEAVLARHADSSYAWWASRRLGRSWEAPPDPAPGPPSASDDPALARGLALLEAGIDDWAAAELRTLASRAKRKGRDHTLALAARLADAGEWAEARRLAGPHCGPAHKREDLAALRICWPRPRQDVAASGIGPSLPASLPFAIMRAESAFQPGIVSAAGARGLMQLMPDLAVKLYRERHPSALDPLDPDQLFDPATNVELGVAELAGLAVSLADTKVDPIVPLVIAAYNSGPDPVRRWLGLQPPPVEADRWAEDIGYSETRRYVRKVLGTLQTYRYVYGD